MTVIVIRESVIPIPVAGLGTAAVSWTMTNGLIA
eukprot:CAMPEP_0175052910 /NCGR_PEP_ID=MMETSP0052_2-20121109/8623_1 /TAXON_ID=51329 ORGANISM="Polytomella parva, Strain SAG 63-3" /NCGR_SAMPLE_ID=MMETSP0052_2 /ASSEMBLY_ACC=CAM_ASM_000194 /LENGTH=33 /DNA_ID= /DNA_START= /DNA_END= /DNA_ORIENTATION=